MAPGPLNAITDVAGVRVGLTTVIKGEGPRVEGKGPARTGVTAILAHDGNVAREAVTAAVYDHNGNGEVIGCLRIREAGLLASPVLLTGTWNVGRVWDFALGPCSDGIRRSPMRFPVRCPSSPKHPMPR